MQYVNNILVYDNSYSYTFTPTELFVQLFYFIQFLLFSVNHGKQNMVAQFLQLFHHFLHLKPINQNNFISTHGSSTIGALLQEVALSTC